MLKPVSLRTALTVSAAPMDALTNHDFGRDYQKLLQKFISFSTMLQDKLSAMEEIHHYSKNVIYKEYEQLEQMVINLQEHYQAQFLQLQSILQQDTINVQQKYEGLNKKWENIFSMLKQKCDEIQAENTTIKHQNQNIEEKITFLTQENAVLLQENEKLKHQVKQWMDVSLLTIPMVNLLNLRFNSHDFSREIQLQQVQTELIASPPIERPPPSSTLVISEQKHSTIIESNIVNNTPLVKNVEMYSNTHTNDNWILDDEEKAEPNYTLEFCQNKLQQDFVTSNKEEISESNVREDVTKEAFVEIIQEEQDIINVRPEETTSSTLSSSLADEEETLHSSMDGSSYNTFTPSTSLTTVPLSILQQEVATEVPTINSKEEAKKDVIENAYPSPDYSNFKDLKLLKISLLDSIVGTYGQPSICNGALQECSFNSPVSICTPSSSHISKPNYPYKDCVFVAESGNQTIRLIRNSSQQISTILQFPTLVEPSGICISQDGMGIIVLDAKQNQIYLVDIETGLYSVVFSTKELNKSKVDKIADGIVDIHNNILYIAHQSGLAKMNLNTRKISLIGKKVGYRDGLFEKCMFQNPGGLCFLDSSTLLVADSGNHSIRVVDLTNGIVETFCGSPYSNLGNIVNDGVLADANFFYPKKIALFPRRAMIFVTEQSNHVRVIDFSKQQVMTLKLGSEQKDVRGLTFYEESKSISLYICNNGKHCLTKLELDN